MAANLKTLDVSALAEMSIDELKALREKVDTALEDKVSTRRNELLAELEALGGAPKARAPRASALDGTEPRKRASPKVKFQDDKGNAWSGRGATPRWLQAYEAEGRKREEFLVEK